jgi:acetate---CoA ligase (ADP-forming)
MVPGRAEIERFMRHDEGSMLRRRAVPYGWGAMTSTGTAAQVVAETDIALRDGSTVHVRPSTIEDLGRLRAFLESLSDESRWFRFFSAAVDLDAAARSAASPSDGLSLIALRGSEAAIVAHGTYLCGAGGRAEVAFAVADAWHGHGIATVLLAHLAHAASTAGINTFTATVLAGNHRMLGVFHESGFLVSARRSEEAIEIEFPTSLSQDARRRFEERQREADVAAVGHVLRPSSVAVIGASRRPGTVGGEVVRNLLAAGFSGPLHLVNVRGGEVAGRPTVPAIADVEGEVELAVIVVPTNAIVDVARACAAKGVRALVVLTGGFAEVGPAGRARQDELLAVCRAAGMRMVGPNSLGVASPRPEIALDATVAPAAPPPGDVGFASQSGGFGSAAIDAAAARGIGFSSFVTMGDKADLSGNDFLEYWEQDPDTAVLVLYLDSFGNPRRFARIARRITTAKPIVAVKSARTAGPRSASSRTGALLAAADVTVDALFAHAGVLRAETVGEMFDVAGLLARQPLPPGDRVAVLTNAGGPGVACEDACAAAGLRVEPLSDATRKQLAEGLGADVPTANPVDMTASATADQYERSLRVLLDDDGVDAVVTLFVRPLAARAAEVARGIAAAAQGADRPVLAVWLGADGPAAADAGVVPRFTTPEEAVRALAHAVRHARRRTAPPDPPYEPSDADTATAATTVAEGLGRGGGWLTPGDVERLLRCWGIPVVASRLAPSPQAAGRAAAELGGPVALKAVAPGLFHKSDVGAVRLGLAGPTAVSRAAVEMAQQLEAAGTTLEGFRVQRMAPEGPELIVGAVGDPAFGPLVACGAGGVAAELLGDIQVRIAPLGPREADGMLRDLKTFPLLDGYRGRPRADLGSVRDLVMRVGALVAAHPAVAELDLNPVIATPEGALVVNARVRVDAPGPAASFPSLNA